MYGQAAVFSVSNIKDYKAVGRRSRGRAAILVAVTLMLAIYLWIIVNGNPTGRYLWRSVLLAAGFIVLLGFASTRPRRRLRWQCAAAGFALTALGLSAYLHLAFLFDWQNIASDAVTPALLFRFLPAYAAFAGVIGAAIGWIIGRGIER